MRKEKINKYLLGFLAICSVLSCTDLEIDETDSLISVEFNGVSNSAESVNTLFGSAGGLLGDQANTYALREVTTDALLIPTRGADWGDNGRWRELHQHEWGLEETDVVTPFQQWSEIQLEASQVIDARSNATAEEIAAASFIRAYAMWSVLDFYGQVPFRDTTAPTTDLPITLSGATAVDFIVADLQTAIAGLPATATFEDLDRGSKAAARFLLAKVLLNKHIYLNQLTEGGGAPDAVDMQTVINLVDEIGAEGFALQEGYFEIFRNTADSETIWWTDAQVSNRIFNTAHYNLFSEGGGGWNGFSTLAEYFDLFEGDLNSNTVDTDENLLDNQEERRGGVPPTGLSFTERPGTVDENGFETGSNVGNGFLLGPQYGLDGTQLLDRPGAPLAFTREFLDNSGSPNIINNNEQTGIRVMKYNPRFGAFTGHSVQFRFADAHLMRAEARMRMGGDPTAEVNELRVLRSATPLGAVSEQDLADERARELFIEGWRRNDMIRFGQYLRGWEFKGDTETNNSTRLLFPIPLPQLLANPNLVQNSGY